MEQVQEYKRNAKDCRDLARQMPEQQREQLLQMADQWEEIARKRELALADGEAPPDQG